MAGDVPGPLALLRTAPATGDAGTAPGVLDFYRALIGTALAAVHRWRLPIVVELALVALYFLLRTANADDAVMGAWLVAAVVLAVASPARGLVILAAIAPFNEAFLVSRDVGSKSILALALLAAVGCRWLLSPAARARPSAPVILAGLLLAGSGLGLVRTRLRWGADFTELAAQIWLQGVATMLVVFVVAVWTARRGELRPLAAALAATTVAGILSLADYWGDAALRESLLGWAVVGPFNPSRLTGVIRSPTSTAALVMLPATVYLTAAVLGRGRLLRLGAALLATPLLVAAYLTYNRAVFIALWLLAVVAGWRIRRWLGVLILVVGLTGGALLVPWYISVRGQALGGGAQPPPGEVLIASDQMRLTAWGAATRMFLDEPLLGQGYRAYRQLAVEFGDPTLNAPHNEWLRFFAEQGAIVGVTGLAFAAVTLLRLARRRGWLETGMLASFLSFCLAACFNNPFLFNQVTIPAFILAGTGVALAGIPERSDAPDG